MPYHYHNHHHVPSLRSPLIPQGFDVFWVIWPFHYTYCRLHTMSLVGVAARSEGLNWTEPTAMRTTSSIVFSCLFTLLACGWCCIRPNIPSPYDSKLSIIATKLKMLFWMLVTPELVACWTFRQWFEAGKIARDYHYRGWTRRHALFLMMGGFVLARDGLPIQVVSIPLFARLVQQNAIKFPTLTRAQIQERSNFYPIFAAIVLFQVVWFVIQCFSRVVVGLQITQLEVITFTLVISNAITFSFVWQKPLDVQRPIFLHLPPQFDLDRPIYRPSDRGITMDDFDREQRISRIAERTASIELPNKDRISTPPSVRRLLRILVMWPLHTVFQCIGNLTIGLDSLDSNDLERSALKIPLFFLPDSGEIMLIILPVTCVLGMGIGVIHCLFWTWGNFPSDMERLVWRIHSVLFASFHAVSFIILVVIGLSTLIDRRLTDAGVGDVLIMVFAATAGIFFCLTPIPFVGARIILILESFLSLRSLPEEALKVVSWNQYLPHFS